MTRALSIIEQPGFDVIGFRIRTTNAIEATPNGQIAKLWQRIGSAKPLQHLPGRMDSNLYAVYTDYQSDENGAYTFVLGVKVNAGSHPPAGTVLQRVLAGHYALFESQRGPANHTGIEVWKQIWAWPDKGKRLYQTDYEVHSDNGRTDAPIKVYIGVKQE